MKYKDILPITRLQIAGNETAFLCRATHLYATGTAEVTASHKLLVSLQSVYVPFAER